MTSSLADIASCLNGYDPQALRVELAQDLIARLLPLPREREAVPLRQALGRVLARDIVSGLQVPAHDNSAMDGYALRGSDLRSDGETRLSLAGTSLAGSLPLAELPAGHCQRIMTGAVMPAGLDTVVPQEFTRIESEPGGDHIVIPAGAVRPGDNRRLAGEDLALGSVALSAARLLTPSDLGLLASLGQAEVPVWRRLRVAILATGDELRPVGEPLPPGCVYDSNRHTMWAMLSRLGVEVVDLGIVRDDPQALRQAFGAAAAQADVILSSGGVSVGEADHTKAVMAELGEMLFWKIAMRPGRPMAVGRIIAPDGREVVLFGLPGNPVAVMVSFYAFVRAALLRMSGATAAPLPLLRARTVQTLRKKPGRTEFQRAIVSRGPDGRWQAEITGQQGSGILSSMSRANGLLVLGHDQGEVPAGTEVEVIPFDGLI
ncbi:MAG: gephyrin-like molybdotransferase Glp [Burkholderiaceae bacterium]